MFSRSKKKSNLNENLPLSPDRNSKIIDPKHQNFDPVDPTSYEPSVKKKMKVSNNSYTTQSLANEYKQAVEEMTSDLKYKARPELIGKTENVAFGYNEIDTDYTQDSKAIAMKNIKISQEIKAGKLDNKFYKGLNGYAEYNEKSDNSIRSSKFTGSLGPIRAPKHIRVTCRIDYNPSLCKDWHDTGSCVFGDSCIYIHDRGDYKSGWELEKEWEEDQKKRAKNNGHVSDLESDTEDPSNNIQVPEICQICNEKLKNPVITLCEHFFCEKCALTQYSKCANCYVCKRPTNGTFNEGGKVIKKLKDIKDSLKKIKGKDKTKNTIKEISEDREFEMPDIDENEKRKLLEGVEFGVDKVGEDEELKGLAGEFIRKRAKQKSQIKYDSDWLV